MKKLFKFKYIRLFSLTVMCLLTVILPMSLTACDTEDFNIYVGVDTLPKTLDPQRAESFGELIIARNCFKGLFSETVDGSFVPELAESYSVTDDGLCYTFKLKEAYWNDSAKTAVTADDFLFALTRASDPETLCPSSDLISNISGASERLSGDSSAQLGARVIDSKTLEITLASPNENFVKMLTTAAFKPCNRKFFEGCGGKYGLGTEYILTNGDYKVSKWSDGRSIKLTLNDTETYALAPKAVFLTMSTTGKNNVQRIIDGEIGMAVNGLNDYSSVNRNRFQVSVSYNKSYALMFNRSSEVGQNELLTAAFAEAIDRSVVSAKMSDRFKLTDTVLPEVTEFNSEAVTIDTSVCKYAYNYDQTAARAHYLEAVKQLKNGKLDGLTVLSVDTPEIKAVLSEIVSQWQQSLGAYVNITTVSSEQELIKKIDSGSYTVALVPLFGSADGIISRFCDSDSGFYRNNPELNRLSANRDADTKSFDFADFSRNCISVLSKDSGLIPTVTVPTAYIYDITYRNVAFSKLDGSVSFSSVYKK